MHVPINSTASAMSGFDVNHISLFADPVTSLIIQMETTSETQHLPGNDI